MSAHLLRILGSDDEEALKRFLVSRLDSSLFLYGNMLAAGLTDTGERFSGTYAAAFDESRVVAVVGHFWNETMVLQAPDQIFSLMQLAQQSCGRPLKRLVGPNEQVGMAIRQLGLTSADLQMDEPERLYSLELKELIVPDILAEGRARARLIVAEDEDLVTGWRMAYYRELHMAQDSDELHRTTRQHVQAEIASGSTWILEVEGMPVSCTSFNALVSDKGIASIVQVGGVYTPQEMRSRGYARAVVAASLIDARSQGYQKSVLFTGISNVSAQKAYKALGYSLIGAYRITVLRKAILEVS